MIGTSSVKGSRMMRLDNDDSLLAFFRETPSWRQSHGNQNHLEDLEFLNDVRFLIFYNIIIRKIVDLRYNATDRLE